MNEQIKLYDHAILKMATVTYPETQALTQVHGVGSLTAVTYVLTLGSKERFERSRDVGCYLGLRPKRSQSGDRDPQLRITKAGNEYLRRLLTECANFILGRFGKDSSLNGGVSTWLSEAERTLERRPSSQLQGNWQFCCIVSG
jgi:transposase